MNDKTTVIPSVMRLAFESAIRVAPRRSAVARVVRESLKHRKGITYRHRMWSVQRAKKNGGAS